MGMLAQKLYQSEEPEAIEPNHGIRVLVVDDEIAMGRLMVKILMPEGYEAMAVDRGVKALQIIDDLAPAVVLLDLVMPDMDGLTCLKEIRARAPETMVVMVTAHGTIEIAVEAMKQGAEDFLTKPFTHEQLRLVVKRVAEKYNLARENSYLREELALYRQKDGELAELLNLQDLERKAIIRALAASGGHRKKAADMLGISIRTMQYKIKEYGLRPEEKRDEGDEKEQD